MRKIVVPAFNHLDAFTSCLDGIGSRDLVDRYTSNFPDPAAIEGGYVERAQAATLFEIAKLNAPYGTDPVVANTLTRDDLTKLYNSYFMPSGKPGRFYYDKLKVSGTGKCPFCGDIGHVRTLDHYLPKANYPLYSILPANLVPCCRDCNTEKLAEFSSAFGEQGLHPYYDNDKFFEQNWIHARVIQGAPPVVEFLVNPPCDWSALEKTRVAHHFKAYGLASRFGVEAGADLPETIMTRRTTFADLTPAEFASYLNEKSLNPSLPINNWRRVMFRALALDPWFCTQAHL